jgi:hypothetical protein
LCVGEGATLSASQEAVNDAEEVKEEKLSHNRGCDPKPAKQEGTGNPREPREETHKEIQQGGLRDPVADGVGCPGQDGSHGQSAKN